MNYWIFDLDGYKKTDGAFCGKREYSGYRELSDVTAACNLNPSCPGFYDPNGTGDFYLMCVQPFIKKTFSGSILYEKCTMMSNIYYLKGSLCKNIIKVFSGVFFTVTYFLIKGLQG